MFKRIKEPKIMITFGMFFIALGSLMRYVHPATDLTDGVMGVFYGVAIGLMGLGTWLNGRQRNCA
jgi:cyanate permease